MMAIAKIGRIEWVRVVSIGPSVDALLSTPDAAEWMDHSVEFCGGTHLDATSDAGGFILLSEQGLAAGIRRIVGVTGAEAETVVENARGIRARLEKIDALGDDQLPEAFDELNRDFESTTLGATDRELIQAEYDQLSAQLNQTATSSNFAGKPLLDGSLSGAGAAVIHDGASGDTRIELGDASATALGVEGLDVANPDTLTALDNAQSLLSSERARLGTTARMKSSIRVKLAWRTVFDRPR